MRQAFDNGEVVGVAEADIYFDERESSSDPAEMAREILNLVVGSPNPALQAEILCLLLGVGFRGCSGQESATRHRVTRAAVSARLVAICEIIGLARPVGPMRTVKTRGKCGTAAKYSHMN